MLLFPSDFCAHESRFSGSLGKEASFQGGRGRSTMRNLMKRFYFILFFFFGIPSITGCNYLVKNEEHRVYSKPRYGIDHFIVAKGYHIHYVEIPSETSGGETVVLTPGAFSTYRSWNRMIPFLSRHYRLLALDYVGTGDSDKPHLGFDYKIEEQADLIAEIVQKLKLPKIHLVGASYGGVIALNFATRYPERTGQVVCIEGGVVKPEKMPNNGKKGLLRWPLIGDFFISAIRSGLFDQMTAMSVMGKAWESLAENEKEEIVQIISQNNKTASRISWYRISRTFENSKDFVEEVKGIQVPVLYLYGKRSEFRSMAELNVQFFKTYLPGIEMVDFEDGVHDLELQKPEEVARLVLKFLERNRKDEKKEAQLQQ